MAVRRSAAVGWVMVGAAAVLPLAGGAPAAADGGTELVSVDVSGGDGGGHSGGPDLSGDGRFVAFTSSAQDLVDAPGNERGDVYVRDRLTGTTARVSVDAEGGPADNLSEGTEISDDGRYVLFGSYAEDLLPEPDRPIFGGYFVRDMATGTTELASVLPDGTPARASSVHLSGDGRVVVFQNRGSIHRRDLRTGVTERLFGAYYLGGIDRTGSRIGLATERRLVDADDNDLYDAYVWDVASGTAILASAQVAADGGERAVGGEAPVVSDDGTAAAFESRSDQLVPRTGPSDHGAPDLFVRDLETGRVVQGSVGVDGEDTTKPWDDYFRASLSDDGSLVAFVTRDSMVEEDTFAGCCGLDVYVLDLATGEAVWASSDRAGGPPDGWSSGVSLSGDGAVVAFGSQAEDLVAQHDDAAEPAFDVFLTPVDAPAPLTRLVSVGSATLDEGDVGPVTVNVPVSMSSPSRSPVTVDWSTVAGSASAPGDFAAASGTVTIPAGAVSGQIAVVVHGDDLVEDAESFTVHLDAAAGAGIGRVNGVVTLEDDEEPVLTVAPADVWTTDGGRGRPAVEVPVRLSAPATADVSVEWFSGSSTATDGIDFLGEEGTLVIPAGEVNATVPVTILGNLTDGSDKALNVYLHSPVGVAVGRSYGVVTLRDDDPSTGLTIAVGDVRVPEGDTGTGVARFPVVLSEPAPAPVTVEWSTVDGTATAPDDYDAASGSLVIPAGALSGVVEVRVHADATSGDAEAFGVALGGASGGTIVDGSGAGTIGDDDPMWPIWVSDVTVDEPDSGNVMATLVVSTDRPAENQLYINWQVAPESAGEDDIVYIGGSAVIPAGARSTTIKVPVVGDTVGERQESFEIMVNGWTYSMERVPVLADGVGVVTIRRSDGGP